MLPIESLIDEPIPVMASTIVDTSSIISEYDHDANYDLIDAIKVNDYHLALNALNRGADNYEEVLDMIAEKDNKLIILNEKRKVIRRLYEGIPEDEMNIVIAAKAADYETVNYYIEMGGSNLYAIAFLHLIYDIDRHYEFQRTYLSLLDAGGIKLNLESIDELILLNATMILLDAIINQFDTYVDRSIEENHFIDHVIKKAIHYDSPDILEMILYLYRNELLLSKVVNYYKDEVIPRSDFIYSLNKAFLNLADNVANWSELKQYIV